MGPEVLELALRLNEASHSVAFVGAFAHRQPPDSPCIGAPRWPAPRIAADQTKASVVLLARTSNSDKRPAGSLLPAFVVRQSPGGGCADPLGDLGFVGQQLRELSLADDVEHRR